MGFSSCAQVDELEQSKCIQSPVTINEFVTGSAHVSFTNPDLFVTDRNIGWYSCLTDYHENNSVERTKSAVPNFMLIALYLWNSGPKNTQK